MKIRGDTNEIEKRKQWRKSIKPFGFKKKINEIGKYLKRWLRQKEKIQITKLKNENGDMTFDSTRIKMIMRDDYDQLYDNSLNN